MKENIRFHTMRFQKTAVLYLEAYRHMPQCIKFVYKHSSIYAIMLSHSFTAFLTCSSTSYNKRST